MRDVSKKKDVGKVVMRSRKAVVRAKDGELRQEDVAKDFGVTRQTVNNWEREQTSSPPNKSWKCQPKRAASDTCSATTRRNRIRQ